MLYFYRVHISKTICPRDCCVSLSAIEAVLSVSHYTCIVIMQVCRFSHSVIKLLFSSCPSPYPLSFDFCNSLFHILKFSPAEFQHLWLMLAPGWTKCPITAGLCFSKNPPASSGSEREVFNSQRSLGFDKILFKVWCFGNEH